MHLALVHRCVDRCVSSWAVSSQQRSRRNAMVAATALTQRRADAREVEDFLASRAVRRTGTDVPAAVAPR